MDKEVAMEVEYLPHRDIFRFGASVLHCLFFFLVYKSPPSIALFDVTKSKTHQNWTVVVSNHTITKSGLFSSHHLL